MWDRLGQHSQLLVVGGGINGVGIARDAARRGLSVSLVEQHDLAFGTSSRSSKLVHGGLRYLEQFLFGLVFEAVSERRILMDIAPHLVNPLGFLFPVYTGDRRSLATISAGMMLYDGLSLFRSPKLHRRLDTEAVAEEEPSLKQDGLKGAPLYYDASTDDARLTLETALDAAAFNAVIATHARVTRFLHDESGRVCGAEVEDTLSGELKELTADVIINATGPWTDEIRSMSAPETEVASVLRPTKGVHIVVPHDKLPVTYAVVCFHPDDGRVLFAIPWGESTYVGTTDTDYDGDLEEVIATRDDVDYLIKAAAKYFPDNPLGYNDVTCTWAGLRPLVAPPGEQGTVDESAVSREHQVMVSPNGLVTIAGGKLTTYRLMSKEVVDTAVKLLRMTGKLEHRPDDPHTDTEPLPGGVHWPEDDDHNAVADKIREIGGQRLSDETARLLADSYGTRGRSVARMVRRNPALGAPLVRGRPEILAQVDMAVDHEFSATVVSVLKQRSQIFYKDSDQGLGAAGVVADRMAELLGWTLEEREKRLAEYWHEVELSRRWRTEPGGE